jgi:predicted enzyme related to lactoylglutathione lyase
MLPARRAHAVLPVRNLDAARLFYEEVLGFTSVDMDTIGVMYGAGDGSVFGLARSGGARSGTHTQLVFTVPDLRAEMAELRARGVVFETYDLPGVRTEDGVADLAGHLGAWFTDPEGNVIGLIQFAPA